MILGHKKGDALISCPFDLIIEGRAMPAGEFDYPQMGDGKLNVISTALARPHWWR